MLSKKLSRIIKFVFFAVLLTLIASACSNSDTEDTSTGRTGSNTTLPNTGNAGRDRGATGQFVQVGLQSLGTCDALLNRFKTEALEIVGPYGLGEGRGPVAFAEPAILRTESQARGDASASSNESFSTTNVQVKGVDEPDIVKTDGNRIVGISSGELWIVDTSSNPARKTASLILGKEYESLEMFLYKDKVLAVITNFGGIGYAENRLSTSLPRYPQRTHSSIIEIDISDNNPRIINEIIIEGSYVNARRTGSTVNLVVDSMKTSSIGFVNPVNEAGEEIATETNRQVILNSLIEDWVPQYSVINERQNQAGQNQLVPCDEVLFPNEFAGLDITSVLTFNLEEEISSKNISAVVAEGNSIFSSGKNLYLAHQLYQFRPILARGSDGEEDDDDGEEPKEEIWFHKFSTPDGEPAAYQASGRVDGRFLNQFSMHETEDEHFWIVSTINPQFRDEGEPETFVTSFRQEGSALNQTGSVGNIGRNEQVQSVRFVETRAYVVTFRRIDPFYVIDLSNPSSPEIKGELKIPGFSSYLHPLGNDRLLGVGRTATDEGRVTGSKLSLFDATDPTNPQEVRALNLGSGFTNVEWDHRAVLYWDIENRFILPFRSFDTNFYGALAVHIDPDTRQLFEVRRFQHQDSTSNADCREPLPDEEPVVDEGGGSSTSPVPCRSFQRRETISRAIVIGDSLWTLSDNFLEERNIANPEEQADATVRITNPNPSNR